MRLDRICALSLALALVFAAGASAVVQPKKTGIEPFNDPSMDFVANYQPATSLSGVEGALATGALASLGVPPQNAYLDVRGNRWGTLMPTQPLLPGNGVGNNLVWSAFADGEPQSIKELEASAWAAFASYIQENSASLRIDFNELGRGRVTVHGEGDLIQIYAPRTVGGVLVRGSFITATINQGNLVLFGATKWGDVTTLSSPRLDGAQAFSELTSRLDEPVTRSRKAPYLNFIPTGAGRGYDYRLVWVLSPNFEGERGRWEALIDAHSGEYLALQDLNHYEGAATRRRVLGGVLPVSNDGVPPDGVEQAGWPMGWSDVTVDGETAFTDGGGNLGFCAEGTISTSLAGQFMLMNDDCGAINETSGNNLNLGTSGGTDCTVPPGSSPGNTHASRSGFFEMNQIKAQARGQLPSNSWVRAQLQSNMNINSTCNAFWDGSTVNFYRSGGGCNNTGELAGVYDHEWGHGMDNNDANPTISDPGEGIADIYAALRLDDSCMGRNFQGGNCGGYGDPCTMCSGVRDIDWANRASGIPHTVTWSIANCGTTSHCRGAIYAEAVWDLFKRDLTAPPFNYDHVTAIELATRLTYTGASPVGSWFLNTPPFGGCNADGGYLNYLAADDDNGSLADGTPHMSAIFAAFNRHEAACGSPTVTDFGCAAGPSTAPAVLSLVGIDKGAVFDIGTVAGAASYDIFRTDGVFGCNQGKIKVGSVDVPASAPESSIIFVDEGLQNGREYWYTAIAVGASDACTSPASTCTAVTPPNSFNLALDTAGVSVVENIGDDDGFIDNCEEVTAEFDVNSIGTGNQTNVRIVSVENLSHPSTVITTGIPSTISGFMGSCATETARVNFQPQGMSFDDTLELRVGITSDQLDPVVKYGVVSIGFTESDLENFASKTFSFEADGEGWTVTTGSFDRTGGGGGNGTTFSRDSTTLVDANCDTIRSPLLSISPTSTLSLWNNYEIEPLSGGTWYDRANVGLVDTSNNRTLVTPDSGRLYNADSSGPGTYGGCNEPEEGWADTANTWGTSSWSAAAFGAVAPAGLSQLEVIYGTDAALALRGFWFDEVTVTDVGLQVPDTSSDTCAAPVFVFSDGFESGDISAWGTSIP